MPIDQALKSAGVQWQPVTRDILNGPEVADGHGLASMADAADARAPTEWLVGDGPMTQARNGQLKAVSLLHETTGDYSLGDLAAFAAGWVGLGDKAGMLAVALHAARGSTMTLPKEPPSAASAERPPKERAGQAALTAKLILVRILDGLPLSILGAVMRRVLELRDGGSVVPLDVVGRMLAAAVDASRQARLAPPATPLTSTAPDRLERFGIGSALCRGAQVLDGAPPSSPC